MPIFPSSKSTILTCISHGFFNFKFRPLPIWSGCLCSSFTLVNPSALNILVNSSKLFLTTIWSCSTPSLLSTWNDLINSKDTRRNSMELPIEVIDQKIENEWKSTTDDT